jgi:glycine dehydrogenase subunit 1
MSYIPLTEEERREMLHAIGVGSIDELFAHIPEKYRLMRALDLPPGLSELEVTRLLRSLAAKNATCEDYVCFLGGGAYDHFVPAVIDQILLRSEYYTAYTPYQAEVSQGTLQSIYEYQTMICELTGMDVANASMYDGASALAEGVLMAVAHTGRKRVLVGESLHPHYLEVIRTYCHGQGIEVKVLPCPEGRLSPMEVGKSIGEAEFGALVVQHPNFFGLLEPVAELSEMAHAAGALLVTSNDPISLALLRPPGRYGADIATGEGQPLGIPLSFGGPYLGFFAVRKELVRRMPGRLIGMTVDGQGRRGFVMTLQTREQHIRRERATSNICTNQALMALAATLYLTLLGPQGLRKVAELCLQKTHYLADRIARLPGYSLIYSGPFFKEFLVRTPVPARDLVLAALEERIFAGVPLSRFWPERSHELLIAVTEKRTREEMDRYVELLKKLA